MKKYILLTVMSVSMVQAVPDFVRTGARDVGVGLGLVTGVLVLKHLAVCMKYKRSLNPWNVKSLAQDHVTKEQAQPGAKKRVSTRDESDLTIYHGWHFAGWYSLKKNDRGASIFLERNVPSEGAGKPVKTSARRYSPFSRVQKNKQPEPAYEIVGNVTPSKTYLASLALLAFAPISVRLLQAWQKRA